MNRRATLALATAATTVLTMTVPAVAEEVPPTTAESATTAGAEESTTEQGAESPTPEETSGQQSSGSSEALGSSGASETTDVTEQETLPGLDAEGRCPNGELPDYPALVPDEEPKEDSFLGPYALFEEITGSSIPGAATDTPTGADEFGCTKEQQMDPADYPEWMHSSIFPSEEVKTVLAAIEAMLIVGMTVTQVATIAVQFVPGAREELRDLLTSFGINVDA